MRFVRSLVLGAGLIFPACTWAQMDPQAARMVQDSLTAVLGVLLPGYADPSGPGMRVIQDGADVHVVLPVKGAEAPLRATLQPDGSGAWNIVSMALPPEGTVALGAGASRHYVIGRQAIQGRIDPTFATASSGKATLEDLQIVIGAGAGQLVETVGRSVSEMELAPRPGGLLDLRTSAAFTALSVATRQQQQTTAFTLHATRGQMLGDISGIDPAHAVVLRDRYRSIQALPTGKDADERRERLRGLLDALPGTLNHLDLQTSAEDLVLQVPGVAPLLLGREQTVLTAGASDGRVDATLLVDIDGLSVPGAPSGIVELLPRRMSLKLVLTGFPATPLMALLHDALSPGADQAGLTQRFLALLRDPGASVALEAMRFEVGPMAVAGSARLLVTAGGRPGAMVHLRASGVDALLAQAQGNPGMQGATLGLLMMKGLGRAEGDALVWDIALGDGPPVINGVRLPGSPPLLVQPPTRNP